MRQVSNTGQSTGSISDQKKSVFDRLGRQLDTGGQQRSMKRRPSPGQYGGDYMPPPHSMHDPNNYHPRYNPRDSHGQALDIDWRYQNNINDRRHMPPFARERHQPPHPTMSHMQSMPLSHSYDMDPRQAPYYSHPPHPGYHGGQQNGPTPAGPNMNPNDVAMSLQRSSPKYDRHGNIIVGGFKDRGPPIHMGGTMDHHSGMTPSRSFLPGPGGTIMHPGQGPHDHMPLGMRPNMYSHPQPPIQHQQRWHDNLEPDFSTIHDGRIVPDGNRFAPTAPHRFQNLQMRQQQQQQLVMNQQGSNHPNIPTHGYNSIGVDVPRYAKWKERRDVITSLDRETAQSSSRTDSLKSSLQQPENRITNMKADLATKKFKQQPQQHQADYSSTNKSEETIKITQKDDKDSTTSKDSGGTKDQSTKIKPKTDPQDISDGEIVDDEDSSDESETVITTGATKSFKECDLMSETYLKRNKLVSQPYVSGDDDCNKYFEPTSVNTKPVGKRKRLHDRDDYSTLDYETISDEDLDDIMGNKKVNDSKIGLDSEKNNKSLSEIELLNALGLDWANLVELAKQSKTTNKDSSTQSSALARFSLPNYLPTLGITQDLAGTEIYELVARVCRS